MSKIFLSLPYTGMEQKSFDIANEHAAKLISQGHIVFSPISHSHPIAKAGNLPGGFEFWWKQNKSFLDWCDEVVVLMVEGWLESSGVQREVHYATKIQKPVHFVEVA